ANGETRFDGVHEMQPDARNGRRILEFGDGRHVELRNASAVERAEQKDRTVGLIGVSDFTRKILDEPPGGAPCRVWTGGKDRAIGLQVRHHLEGSCEFLHRENFSWEAPSELVRGSAGPLPETNQQARACKSRAPLCKGFRGPSAIHRYRISAEGECDRIN